MKLPRRKFLHLTAGAAVFPAVSRIAKAQGYPTRPVRIVVGYPAHAAEDIFARLVGEWLSERLGRPFVIENVPGTGRNNGVETVVRAPADGYTLLQAGPAAAFNATLYETLSFNFIRDIAPVASVFRGPFVVVVNLSVPAKTISEFIGYAKANPGKISMGSTGIGSGRHLIGELFQTMTGIKMVHLPYAAGAPALADLVGGQLQVLFDPLPTSIGHIKAGKVRALEMTSAMRWEALPDVPTVGETVTGYEASGWSGVAAPRNTPAEIIDKLNKEINSGLADPKFRARLASLGVVPLAGTAADFGNLIIDETEKWGKVVKFAGIKAR